MIVGTAGHIDHGKTSLVRALTGVDTDRLPEEKRRGITIELGFAPLELEGIGTVAIVDVPGHEGFVRTMVAGATGVDAGLIVVAADEGVMPQTREHVAILSLLGMTSAVVALTKVDAVDEEWLALVEDDVRQFLRGTPFADAPIIATSARTGHGIDGLRDALRAVLQAGPLRSSDDVFRMPIDRAFTVKGTGTVVTGTVWTGRATSASSLMIHPGGRPVRIRALHAHGRPVDEVESATRAAVALSGVDVDEVERGALLVDGTGWQDTLHLHADVTLIAGDVAPIRPREWLRFHLGTTEESCRVVPIGSGADGELSAGTRRLARLVFSRPVVARGGDRFVLRRAQPMATIGGGIVVDPAPVSRRARPSAPWEGEPLARVTRFLERNGTRGMTEPELSVRAGVRPSMLKTLVASDTFFRHGNRVYLMWILYQEADAVVATIDTFHREHSLEPYAPTSVVRVAHDLDDAPLAACVEIAVSNGEIEAVPGGYRRVNFTPVINAAVSGARASILETLSASPTEPPTLAELRAVLAGVDPVPILRHLERDGLVVQVEAGRFYSAEALEGILATLREEMSDGSGKSPAQLREALGMSRKYLIPLLEYCDRRRITERRGDSRVLAS